MKRFALLFRELDQSTRTTEKVAAMVRYFQQAPDADAAWALHLLSGNRLKGVAKSAVFHRAALRASNLSEWLLNECHEATGDFSEAVALVIAESIAESDATLAQVMHEWVRPMSAMSESAAEDHLIDIWLQLGTDQRLVFNKLVRGGFRVGVSRGLVIRALAELAGIEPAIIAHRLSGRFRPTPEAYRALIAPAGPSDQPASPDDAARPYPFYLASQLTDPVETLGNIQDWMLEYKWDGTRAQLIRRAGHSILWSRGEELVTHQFPEIASGAASLPDGTVLDGEVLAWDRSAGAAGRALSFNALQSRLNRKNPQPSLFDTQTVVFMAFDILESSGQDLRARPQAERRAALEQELLAVMARNDHFKLSPVLTPESWAVAADLRASARQSVEAEGLMLKHRASPYMVGRVITSAQASAPLGASAGAAVDGVGGWWKWKIDPFTVDAVLIYAQAGSGKRAGLFTDYTFGVWSGSRGRGDLIPFAKAYSGLTNEEILEVDRFVRNNSLDRKGPVRLVKPQLVFELAFEGIARSARHRSGIAVRFPRMARWRKDKSPADADTLEFLNQLVEQHGR